MDYLSSFAGHSKVTFTHHKEPLSLRQRSNGSTHSLLSICEASTPACRLNPLLFNGHLQTGWTAAQSADILIYYKRHIFSSERPELAGTFAVDFVVPSYSAQTLPNENKLSWPPRTSYFTKDEFEKYCSEDDGKPLVIALHGLSGGSHEIYLRCVLQPLVDAGWEACVVNSRGCAGTKLTTGILYNARATWDCHQIVTWARKTWPKRKLFGIGFSLGANILMNYLGEIGDECPLKAAVVCSNPWNLDVSSVALRSSWIGLNVYSRAMGTSMKKLFERHVDEVSKNPRVNVERVRKITYLHEFDRELQGPVWGYPSEGAYYRDASSCDSVCAVRVPLLAINAEDDPIVHRDAIPWVEFTSNPYAVLLTTTMGGHLSWFEWGGDRWFAKPASRFLMRMAEELEVEKPDEPTDKGPSADDLKIEANPPPFLPMRRHMQMPHEPLYP
ncbi:MAG: hypothetical protein LQ340_007568 [Diploschistes diacapsis]|nr:MAG: hypothetical protein LQ340_007568 [Diploschistes diacapsis]